ncbi:glycosyltransferase [Ferruginibacter sp. SUN106]|uniref:glycosyltransferase n=1 Tax=Ferruginibacter sp. SUN106 TaxID=2978348 RepID=UPI003D36B7A3
MKFEKINIKGDKRRILLAPLDWGLGHATRCIPIIYSLLAQNFEVIIAADGAIKNLLKKEFPDVVFTHLKGYKIRYSTTGRWLPVRLLMQFPGVLKSIFSEHQWLKAIAKEYQIDIVISDNRLGLYHSTIPGIYITHQLQIKTSNRFTTWLAQKIHYFFINKYNTCWVPDNASGDNNLAGTLSHPKKFPSIPVQYLGPLSRFEKFTVEKKYDLLVLLSGPEPQRTILETTLLNQLKKISGRVLVVRGLPGDEPVINNGDTITIVNHLTATELNNAVMQADWIICRSGYTTIMDLVKLGKKAILIPTPGQTEQEYLAAYLMQKKIFFSVLQKDFVLADALQNAEQFSFTNILPYEETYKKAIEEMAANLKA